MSIISLTHDIRKCSCAYSICSSLLSYSNNFFSAYALRFLKTGTDSRSTAISCALALARVPAKFVLRVQPFAIFVKY